MEVIVGFRGAAVGAAAACVRNIGAGDTLDNGEGVNCASFPRRMIFHKRNGNREEEEAAAAEESDRSSSSIGVPDDSDEEGEGEVTSEVVVAKEGFGSLASLDDSLPVKRGLSSHFSGKSKSFTNLSEAIASTSAKEMEKTVLDVNYH